MVRGGSGGETLVELLETGAYSILGSRAPSSLSQRTKERTPSHGEDVASESRPLRGIEIIFNLIYQ